MDADIEVDEHEVLALMRRVGQPFGDTSIFACHRIFSSVVQRHKVCLSGDGADEIFAGYPMRRILGLQKLLTPVLAVGRPGRPLVRDALRSVVRRYFHRTRLPVEQMVRPEVLRSHHDPYAEQLERDVSWALEQTDDLINIVSYLLTCRNLPNSMLVKVDRSSMHNSLEVRVPFLDHRVVEACLRLPGAAKQTWSTTKRPLRDALVQRGFTREFLATRKSGFGPPHESWSARLRDLPLSEEFQEVLTDEGVRLLASSVYGRLAGAWQAAVRG